MIVIKRVSPPIKKMYSKKSKFQIVKLRDLIVAAERVKLKAHSPPRNQSLRTVPEVISQIPPNRPVLYLKIYHDLN